MTRIITAPCVGVKSGECVDVCPVDCIHPKKDEPDYANAKMLYINPEECIDCGACEAVCPVEAIYPEDSVPDAWKAYIPLNSKYYKEGLAAAEPPGR